MIKLLVHEYKPERPEDARLNGVVRLTVRLMPPAHRPMDHTLAFHAHECTAEQLAAGLETLAAKIREAD